MTVNYLSIRNLEQLAGERRSYISIHAVLKALEAVDNQVEFLSSLNSTGTLTSQFAPQDWSTNVGGSTEFRNSRRLTIKIRPTLL